MDRTLRLLTRGAMAALLGAAVPAAAGKPATKEAWSPASTTVQFATWCSAGPMAARWTGSDRGEGCLLPWSAAGATEWAPDAKGWIDLDPNGLQAVCGGDETPRHRELAVVPPALLVRVPAGEGGRSVHVRRRVLLGVETDGGFRVGGLAPPETLLFREGVGPEGAVLTLPMPAVTAGATMAVALEVEVSGVAGSRLTVVQVVWPLNC